LWTDASGLGFGAVLEQVGKDGCHHPVAYACHQTNAAEVKYVPTKLEVVAFVYLVTHFDIYLLGNNFTVYMDHQALVNNFITHIKSQVKGLLSRWYLKLSPFLPYMQLEFSQHRCTVNSSLTNSFYSGARESQASFSCVRESQASFSCVTESQASSLRARENHAGFQGGRGRQTNFSRCRAKSVNVVPGTATTEARS